MGIAEAIRGAMEAAGELARYEADGDEIAAVSGAIDCIRATPPADDVELAAAREELHELHVRRRHLKWRRSRTLEAFAGQVAREGLSCAA
ncbi:hypothetical protein [Microbacterium sp. K24]|uniref:hypothetical protein n=1 Tax=Microbacterium sp. K24 TaxID=2305446 RepID=UPI00109D6B22|nr:hypothetical protein [Microbacterium sp. K24]